MAADLRYTAWLHGRRKKKKEDARPNMNFILDDEDPMFADPVSP